MNPETLQPPLSLTRGWKLQIIKVLRVSIEAEASTQIQERLPTVRAHKNQPKERSAVIVTEETKGNLVSKKAEQRKSTVLRERSRGDSRVAST